MHWANLSRFMHQIVYIDYTHISYFSLIMTSRAKISPKNNSLSSKEIYSVKKYINTNVRTLFPKVKTKTYLWERKKQLSSIDHSDLQYIALN